jgi:hypothetical protein
MCEPRRLTTPWAFTACYRDGYTFLLTKIAALGPTLGQLLVLPRHNSYSHASNGSLMTVLDGYKFAEEMCNTRPDPYQCLSHGRTALEIRGIQFWSLPLPASSYPCTDRMLEAVKIRSGTVRSHTQTSEKLREYEKGKWAWHAFTAVTFMWQFRIASVNSRIPRVRINK